MTRKTIYEPHPVSAERKAELQAQGYRIIDARFAPADAPVAKVEPVAAPVEVAPVEEVIEVVEAPEPKKRGRPSKVASESQISDSADTASEE